MPTPVGLDVALTHTRAAVSEHGTARHVPARTVGDWPSLFAAPGAPKEPPKKSLLGRLFGGSPNPQRRTIAVHGDATIRQIRQATVMDGPVVAAVPAYFSDFERSALAGLLRDFSLHVSRLANAPHAAALCQASATTGPIVVIQVELATFDVCVGQFSGEQFEVFNTDGVVGSDPDPQSLVHALENLCKPVDRDPLEVQAVVLCGASRELEHWASRAAKTFAKATVHADEPASTISRGAALLAEKAQ